MHIVKIYIYVIFAIYFVIFSSLTKVTIFVCLFVDYKNLTMTQLKHTVNVVYFVNNFADTESAQSTRTLTDADTVSAQSMTMQNGERLHKIILACSVVHKGHMQSFLNK